MIFSGWAPHWAAPHAHAVRPLQVRVLGAVELDEGAFTARDGVYRRHHSGQYPAHILAIPGLAAETAGSRGKGQSQWGHTVKVTMSGTIATGTAHVGIV